MRVDSFVREREGKAGIGMIEQSLCHHLQSQLTEYYRLIAVLESQMSASQSSEDTVDGSPGPSGDRREEETGLTLKRLDVWIQEWRLRMRMMSVCVEGAKGDSAATFVDSFTKALYRRHPWWCLGKPYSWLYRQRRPVRP